MHRELILCFWHPSIKVKNLCISMTDVFLQSSRSGPNLDSGIKSYVQDSRDYILAWLVASCRTSLLALDLHFLKKVTHASSIHDQTHVEMGFLNTLGLEKDLWLQKEGLLMSLDDGFHG